MTKELEFLKFGSLKTVMVFKKSIESVMSSTHITFDSSFLSNVK